MELIQYGIIIVLFVPLSHLRFTAAPSELHDRPLGQGIMFLRGKPGYQMQSLIFTS
jgi:hypothetical protein